MWKINVVHDLARFDRPQCKLPLVDLGKPLKAGGLGKKTPVRLQELDRVELMLNLGLDTLQFRILPFGIVLGFVGKGSSGYHKGDKEDVCESEHGSPPSFGRMCGQIRQAKYGKVWLMRRRVSANGRSELG